MNDARAFFLAGSLTHARTLPLASSVLYIRGLLQNCADGEDLEHVRRIYISLSESDKQLELICSQQTKLPLSPK